MTPELRTVLEEAKKLPVNYRTATLCRQRSLEARLMMQFEIKPETAEMLAAQARAHGLPVDKYLKSLLEMNSEMRDGPKPTYEEFIAAMESLAEEDIKPLPRDFSRDDIYFPEA